MSTPHTEPIVSRQQGTWQGEWSDGYTVRLAKIDDARLGIYKVIAEVWYQNQQLNTLAVDLLNPRSREDFTVAMASRNGVAPITWDDRLAKLYDNLQSAQSAAPEASPWAQAQTAQEFCQQDDQDLDATVKDVVIAGCITVVSAPRGSGKSFVALAIGIALAQGGIFRMERLAHQRVLLVDRDNAQDLVRRRLRDLGAAHLTTLKVLTRETAPPLTNKDAWAQFPAEDYDVLIVDSISAFTEGVSEKEGKQTQEFVATLKNLAARGLAILALANTNKAGTNIRGRGEQTDGVDIVYEARNITGWEPEDGPYWWESLPESGEQAWQQNTTRHLNGGALRIGFVPTKFRLGTMPAPFVLEMDTTTRPWTMTDVTTTVTHEGIQAVKARKTAERQKLDTTAHTLVAELQTRTASTIMRKREAENFLRGLGLKVHQARNVLENGYNKDVYAEGLWVLREISGEKGNPVGVYLTDPFPPSLSGEKKNFPNVKDLKSQPKNDTNGVVISEVPQQGDFRNATASTSKNDADFSGADFGNDPGSPFPKSTPLTPAEIQDKNEVPSFRKRSHAPGAKNGSPHEITQRDFHTSVAGSVPSDEGTGQRMTAKNGEKQLVVPYKGGPCPRPGCDGTVIMGVAGQGTRLRCLCGWQEEER